MNRSDELLAKKANELVDRRVDSKLSSECTGCRICEMVCSLYHEDGVNPTRSRIRVVKIREKNAIMPTVCHGCVDPACVQACPHGNITQDETGLITVNEANCEACGKCAERCSFGAIRVHPAKGKTVTCDRCDGRVLCVQYCPQGILEFLHPDNLRSVAHC